MGSGIVVDILVAVLAHFLARLHPRHELLVVDAQEVGALHVVDDFPRATLGILVIGGQITLFHFLVGIKVGTQQVLGQDCRDGLARVGVVGLHGHIVNLRTHAQCNVRRQCPGCGGPSQEIGFAPLCPLCLRLRDEELCGDGGVLHILVAAGLVELVRAEARTVRGRIGLDGISLIEQALVVELLQQPPKGLDILGVVGDVGVLEIDEISHALRQFVPLLGEFHHVLMATVVVLFYRNLFADIFLGNVQFLLHVDLNGQSVGVPTGLALHLEALHGLIAVESVLDGAGKNMVNAGMTVGRRGALKENELGASLTFINTFVEDVVLLPLCQNRFVGLGQIHSSIFGKFLGHSLSCFTLFKCLAQS